MLALFSKEHFVDEKSKKYVKWGIVAFLAVGLGLFVAPVIAAAAWNIVNAAIALTVVAAFYFLAPAVAEGLATLGWKAKELVWKSNPVTKLWRDLYEFGEEIEALNTNVEEVATEEFQFESEIKANKALLGAERVLEWNERLSEIRDSKNFLIEQREELRIMYKEMERDVRINEVEWKLGNAYNKAASAVNKATGIAGGTQGGKVAMATIQHNLSKGRARLQTLRTAKSAAEIREIMKQRANEGVVVTNVSVKAAPALENNPSPVLSVPNTVTAPVTAPAQPKIQNLLDRI